MRGTYIVVAELNKPVDIEVSHKRKFALDRGFYAYIGSALGSLEARIARHLSAKKKYHWHIDYLLRYATVCLVVGAETESREECFVAQTLSRRLLSVAGFGCSDCDCPSHLFFSKDFDHLKKCAVHALRQRNLSPRQFYSADYIIDYSLIRESRFE